MRKTKGKSLYLKKMRLIQAFAVSVRTFRNDAGLLFMKHFCILRVIFMSFGCFFYPVSEGKEEKKMILEMLKGKIHRATVTQAALDYVGSITVDKSLLDAAGILEYEKVQIVDVNNGNRFETYTICGEEGSGMICLNGAAARCVSVGDKIIIMAYAGLDAQEAASHKPAVVFVDDNNRICRTTTYEKHGLLKNME